MTETFTTGVGAAYQLINQSQSISPNLKNGLIGQLKAEDFRAGDLDHALSFMKSRAASPNATPAEKELYNQLQAFKARGAYANNPYDVGASVQAVDQAKAPAEAAPVEAAAANTPAVTGAAPTAPANTGTVSGNINRIADQEPVTAGQTRKVDYARAGSPEESWVQRMIGHALPETKGKTPEEAVRAYQEAHGLRVDGKAGPETLRALLNDPKIPAPVKMSDKDTQKIFGHKPTAYGETKPAAETQPAAETKPAAETQPAAETKPAAETTAKPVDAAPTAAAPNTATADRITQLRQQIEDYGHPNPRQPEYAKKLQAQAELNKLTGGDPASTALADLDAQIAALGHPNPRQPEYAKKLQLEAQRAKLLTPEKTPEPVTTPAPTPTQVWA
ncbi:MAG: peptidoglycan-binding domain-containing protein [Myxococcota bacterium]